MRSYSSPMLSLSWKRGPNEAADSWPSLRLALDKTTPLVVDRQTINTLPAHRLRRLAPELTGPQSTGASALEQQHRPNSAGRRKPHGSLQPPVQPPFQPSGLVTGNVLLLCSIRTIQMAKRT
ncbi:hypothetical protein B5807_07690 [Epicoccum nigrum]|uniref:Uncharacterized protein n=1 Tax=Epicoccum nigrum TaxID=105696 RepID=A0A1Y2LZ93_EPING|nr:hypothetical protein B5807_07690 [Epicoccum nigrum]